MHLGVTMFPDGYAIRPDALALAAQERRMPIETGVDRVVLMVSPEGLDTVLLLRHACAAVRR